MYVELENEPLWVHKKAAARKAFIREHASRLDASYMAACAAQGREPTAGATASIWELARALWDAKPEDC